MPITPPPEMPEGPVACHAQQVERMVKLTSFAVGSCVGYAKQLGTAFLIDQDRVMFPEEWK